MLNAVDEYTLQYTETFSPQQMTLPVLEMIYLNVIICWLVIYHIENFNEYFFIRNKFFIIIDAYN